MRTHTAAPSKRPDLDAQPTPSRWIRLALAPNPFGNAQVELGANLLSSATDTRCLNDSKLGLVQLAAALEAYARVEGALPDRLDALVPSYLDAVPRDRFDGEPLRYSKRSRIVYSIGKNLADDGGLWQTDLSADREPTIRLAF